MGIGAPAARRWERTSVAARRGPWSRSLLNFRLALSKRVDAINQENVMADEGNLKTPLELLQNTLSTLKEMEHYSQTNIEKLAALWLEVSEHKEQKKYETMVDEVLKCQNKFQDSIAALIEAYEEEATRLKANTEQEPRRPEASP